MQTGAVKSFIAFAALVALLALLLLRRSDISPQLDQTPVADSPTVQHVHERPSPPESLPQLHPPGDEVDRTPFGVATTDAAPWDPDEAFLRGYTVDLDDEAVPRAWVGVYQSEGTLGNFRFTGLHPGKRYAVGIERDHVGMPQWVGWKEAPESPLPQATEETFRGGSSFAIEPRRPQDLLFFAEVAGRAAAGGEEARIDVVLDTAGIRRERQAGEARDAPSPR